MAEESKTYVFGNDGGSAATLAPLLSNMGTMPAMMASMMNNGGFGGNGAWWILIILFALWGRNGWGENGGSHNTDAILSALNNDTGRDMVMSAIQGNSTAISQLASTINCDVNSLQTAIYNVQQSIQSVGNQVGMSGQQIINSVERGDCTIANQLAQCCCDLKTSITTQGYENRLQTLEQTNILGSKIDNQTTLINDKFCQLEIRGLQDKVDALREKNSNLATQLSQEHQTLALQSYINGIVSPIATDLASIKCKLPETVNVPYSPVVGIPTCAAYGLGFNSGLFGFNNTGSIWS